MTKTRASAARGDDNRLILTLMCNDGRSVQTRRAARVHIDEDGQLVLYDNRDRVTDRFALGSVTLVSIRGNCSFD